MRKKLLFLLTALLTCTVSTIAQSKGDSLRALPEGVVIKNGMLQPKPGYYFTISPDNKSATVTKMKMGAVSTSGTFTCSCSKSSDTGACGVSILNGGLVCSGNCGCQLTTIITGVMYTLRPAKGVLVKTE